MDKVIRKRVKKLHKATVELAKDLANDPDMNKVTEQYAAHRLAEVYFYIQRLLGLSETEEKEDK